MSLVAVPPGVVTLMVPVVPLPTVALMVLSLVMVKDVAAVPPKATAVAQVKPVPLMVTDVPDGPLAGENPVRVGAGMQVKELSLVAVPPGVVTLMVPVVPLPTVALMVLSLGW